MLNIEASIKDIQNIINYFIECKISNPYYEFEKRSSLGKLALELDKVSAQLNNENIESMKRIIEKVAEANREIAKSSLRKN
ncbi:hypothetical protein ACW7DJ_00275 (plasmid) [Mammaliicoccus sciuri]|uniref:hypothetical protein n=1 Tax=Mammaliicoccus sciuri TaxID=1296 RepID=UPI002DB8CF89|nr:hypothetical protein [Mammaliicoccus sciuri]MEB5648582.1 hypothetical protein [Mammaliicoccus sciuri]